MTTPTVTELFCAVLPCELNGVTVHVRALSDFEISLANRTALAAGGRAIRALRDPNSELYLAHVEPLESGSPDQLRASIAAMSLRRLQREAESRHPFIFFPIPDNASEDEKAEVLARRMAQDEELAAKHKAYLTEKLEALSQSLQEKDSHWLLAEAKRLVQDLARHSAYVEELIWQTLLLCTETQAGDPYFSSMEQVRHLGGQAQDKLYATYQRVNNIDPLASKSPSLMA
jgi:hypothetical protein